MLLSMVTFGKAPFLSSLRSVLLLAETRLTVLVLTFSRWIVVVELLFLMMAKLLAVVKVLVIVRAFVVKGLSLNIFTGLPYIIAVELSMVRVQV